MVLKSLSLGILQQCADNYYQSRNGESLEKSPDLKFINTLRSKQKSISWRCKDLTQKFISAPTQEWEDILLNHRAHTHPWLDYIAVDISLNEFSAFLQENRYFPDFLPMLEKILLVQFTEDGRAAVQDNINDEYTPEPHGNLKRRMMLAMQKRVTKVIQYPISHTLIDRTVTYYYGLFLNSWHLVGSCFGMERLGQYRVIKFGEGMVRLGLPKSELGFIEIHSICDEHHAEDWMARVITPSVLKQPKLKSTIADGLASCLYTTDIYFQYLQKRTSVSELINESFLK